MLCYYNNEWWIHICSVSYFWAAKLDFCKYFSTFSKRILLKPDQNYVGRLIGKINTKYPKWNPWKCDIHWFFFKLFSLRKVDKNRKTTRFFVAQTKFRRSSIIQTFASSPNRSFDVRKLQFTDDGISLIGRSLTSVHWWCCRQRYFT